MDYTVVYVLGAIALVIGLFYGTQYLKKKGLLNSEDIEFISNTLKLTTSIVLELKLPQDDKIRLIASVVADSLDFAKRNAISNSIDEQRVIAVGYAGVLCSNFGILLTDNRKNIIENLIDLALREVK